MTIKSASGCKERERRGFKREKRDFMVVLVVLDCGWEIDKGWKQGEKKAGEKKRMKL